MLGPSTTSEDGSESSELRDGPGPSGLQKAPVTDSPSSDSDEDSNPTVNPTATVLDPSRVGEEEFGRTETLDSQVVESTKDVSGDERSQLGEADQPPQSPRVESQETLEQLQATNSDKDEVLHTRIMLL